MSYSLSITCRTTGKHRVWEWTLLHSDGQGETIVGAGYTETKWGAKRQARRAMAIHSDLSGPTRKTLRYHENKWEQVA